MPAEDAAECAGGTACLDEEPSEEFERRITARRVSRELSTVAIDRKIVDCDYQIECMEALSAGVARGRRKGAGVGRLLRGVAGTGREKCTRDRRQRG